MASLEKIVIRDGNPPRSLWGRVGDAVGTAVRSFTLGPYSLKDRELVRLFGGKPSYSGANVNEATAMSVSAFYCAVTTISWDIASLPLFLYRTLPTGGKERFTSHPLNRVVHDMPNPQTTSFQLRQALMQNVLTTGNAYAEIERDVVGRPKALWHLTPERVSPFYDGGHLRYRVAQSGGREIVLDASDVIHIKGPSPDVVLGTNIVQVAREALGLSIAAERFGATFFGNGSTIGGMLTTSTTLTQPARENLQAAMAARHQGAEHAHRLLLLEPGMSYVATATNPRDSQFNELRVHQIREVARFFRIPVSLLGDLERSTYSNSEQQRLDYYTSCLRPWLVNIEQELDLKLISSVERNQQHCEHVVEGLLRADVEKRGTFYTQMLGNGAMTVNEVRALENLAPIAGGDTARVPMNSEPLRAARHEEQS